MSLQNLLENLQFLGTVYDFRVLIGGFIFFMILDTTLKGFAMWRAARMGMHGWFIVLLLVHSIGILPLLFIQLTATRYRAMGQRDIAPPA